MPSLGRSGAPSQTTTGERQKAGNCYREELAAGVGGIVCLPWVSNDLSGLDRYAHL
jgi:hypothetical protein